jgi:hypothetical protein
MNFRVLKEAYPFNNSKKKDFISAFLFGLFVFLFLFIFQPFGLSNYQDETKTLELAGYGLVTFILLFSSNRFFSLAFPVWFSKASWTVGKNIIYTTLIFFIIGFGNLLYSVLVGYLPISLEGFLYYQTWTILVGVFPVTISTFVVYSQRLKTAMKEAGQLNASLHPPAEKTHANLEIPSQNKSETIKINVDQLLSVKSVENYVEVYALINNQLSKTILRNTLKNIQVSMKEYDFIEQCHRSYIVNLEKVSSFKGNAQGLTLSFNNSIPLEIPVSRSYVQHIKDQLKQA